MLQAYDPFSRRATWARDDPRAFSRKGYKDETSDDFARARFGGRVVVIETSDGSYSP